MRIWEFIADKISSSQIVILMVVIQSEGSSPGRQGFKMAVAEDGSFFGTIGGGIMEHKLVEMAKDLLLKGRFQPFIKHQIHQAEAGRDKSGMICSGSQTIAFYYLDNLNFTELDKIVQHPELSVTFSENGMLSDTKNIVSCEVVVGEMPRWTYIEPLSTTNKVYIVGAGHVGLALGEVLSKLDFETHLLDHRQGLNTMEKNTFVHSSQVIDFHECDRYIPEGDHVYVVIMSFGYRTDKIVLKALLGKKYRFIGMMGSRKKTAVLFEELLREGHPPSDLNRVIAPIGLDIKSETTYEIAISIAAQLIKVKNC
ncbi:MAG: XdhC family protein [Saprospiraceae bacterium]|nr:XdhC family protein [Saprospiraceae bacterium]